MNSKLYQKNKNTNTNSEKPENRKNYYFGLFKEYMSISTPNITEESFYRTLRNEINNEIVKNSLIFHRNPIYETGKQFYNNLKQFLSVVYFQNFQYLAQSKEKNGEKYIEKYKSQAFAFCGVLNENQELENNLIDNGIKLYINKKNLKSLEIELVDNIEFKADNTLIIDNIKSPNISQGTYTITLNDINIEINLNKNEDGDYSIDIKNLNDFGLILSIPNRIQKEITKENLCDAFYIIWDTIAKKIGLNEKETSLKFEDFINSIIKRRNNNVNNWLKKITEDSKELQKKFYNNPNQNDSSLNRIWKICNQKCKECYNKCYLLSNHELEHKCFYDHKCKEKCIICTKSKCDIKDCNLNCEIPMSHSEEHSCKHFHQCTEICDYNKNTKNCKGRCILEYGHTEPHFCGLEIHHCNGICHLEQKARNCLGECNLEYPHLGKEHNCNNQHLCNSKCYLNKDSKGCKEICEKIYNHEGNHICEGKHFCIGICDLKDKADGCGWICNLECPHEHLKHNCLKVHMCKEICYYKDKSIGCKEKCCLLYGHEGHHNCERIHYCKEVCDLINKAKNCGGRCKLEFPHENVPHNCNNQHFCKKSCYYKDKSRNCKNNCSLLYAHEGNCKCELDIDEHKCNKKCEISDYCSKFCVLRVNHSGQCLCGECSCPEACELFNCSRECNKKCKYNAGHKEKEHICNSEKHLCKEECKYKKSSQNCKGFCHLQYGHKEKEHICSLPKEIHLCNGSPCFYKGKARNCNGNCFLEVGHFGEHNCKSRHLCNKVCHLNNISRNCKNICHLKFGHPGKHLCILKEEEHICNKECYLKIYSREGCSEKCHLPAGHKGNCLCENKESNHICNGICFLRDMTRGCEKYCTFQSNHEGPHLCLKKENHMCKGECHLKDNKRTYQKRKCKKFCCYNYKHQGKCLCSEQVHLCNEKCDLVEMTRGCSGLCTQFYGHINGFNNNAHRCNAKHYCKNPCVFDIYYKQKKFVSNKIKCNKICSLEYGHKGSCICQKNHFHPCDKRCCYYGKSKGCNRECNKQFGHRDACLCDIQREFHSCKEKCELCKDSTECGHVFNHENSSDLKCYKCNNEICKLSKKGHLCGIQHDCPEGCSEYGWCKIESFIREEDQEDAEYVTNLGQTINFKYIKFQKTIREKCKIGIPPNEFNHSGNKHSCNSSFHSCGFQCKQCEYYCIEPYGHTDLHFCNHGNIKYSSIHVTNEDENFTYAMVKKENKIYKLTEGESVHIFFCDQYCKEQGQGHTHYFESFNQIINEDVKFHEMIPSGKYVYECKCSYFWENILKFKINATQEEKNKFALCNWKCNYPSHQIPEYCQLKLWHEPTNIIPLGTNGKWLSKGHVFKCSHPKGIYTIFLLDSSGSMASQSQKPTNFGILGRMPNMLGAAIQAIDTYCKLRAIESQKDICSLFGFNVKTISVFENKSVEDGEEILKCCFEKLHPDEATRFYEAFVKAFDLIDNRVDRNELKPIIILLTDGLDHTFGDTITYIEKVSIIFYFI